MIRRWTDPLDGKKWEVWISGHPGMDVTPGTKPGGPVPPGHIHFREEIEGYVHGAGPLHDDWGPVEDLTDAGLMELLDEARRTRR